MPEELTPPQNPSDLAAGRYVVHPAASSTPAQIRENYPEAEIPIPEGNTLQAHTTRGGTQQAQGTQPQPQEGAQAQGTQQEQSQAQSASEAQSTQVQSALAQRMGMESTLAQLRELREAARKAPKRWKSLQQGQRRGDSAASAGKSGLSDALER